MGTGVESKINSGISPYFYNQPLDMALIIFSPLIALLFGCFISYTPWSIQRFEVSGNRESAASIFIGIFTMSHLVIVLVRSHLNPEVFNRFRRRVIIGPLILFVGMMLSSWVLIAVFVVAIWWDVYHSGLQTFGIGRIYDMRCGNDSQTGRNLDRIMNLLLYAGPIVSGVSLWDHVRHFDKFKNVGTPLFAKIPVMAMSYQKYIAWCVIIFGTTFLLYYLWAYRCLQKKGYRISNQKIMLLVSTGCCSIYVWGFNPFGQAFFIMNFFHALQYFTIIWWSERNNVISVLRLKRFRWGGRIALVVLCGLALTYGVWAKMCGESSHLAFSILLTVSMMHFWFDGFIWSVRKSHIK